MSIYSDIKKLADSISTICNKIIADDNPYTDYCNTIINNIEKLKDKAYEQHNEIEELDDKNDTLTRENQDLEADNENLTELCDSYLDDKPLTFEVDETTATIIDEFKLEKMRIIYNNLDLTDLEDIIKHYNIQYKI